MDVPNGLQLSKDAARQVARDREPDSFASAGLGQDERVDAHDPAIGVDQRASAIARVDGRVGLDIADRIIRFELASDRAHDPETHRILKSQGIPQREYQLSLFQRI